MEKYKNVLMGRKQIIINNFLGGISWGIGATVGLAIFFAILGLILSKFDWIPFVGQFVAKLNLYVSQNSPHLLK